MMRFKKTVPFLCLFIVFFLCSCSGYRETNEGLVVSVVGIDKKADNFTVIAQTVIPSDSGTVECETVSASAASVREAFERLGLNAVKPLIFDHCSGIAIGAGNDTDDIFEIFSYAENKTEINLSVNLFYTENAASLVEISSNMRQGGYDITQMIKNRKDNFDNELYVAVKKLSQAKDVKLPLISVKNKKINLSGAYIIENNKKELIK